MTTLRTSAILFAALLATLPGSAQRGSRLRPPDAVDCPRNKLTSFTGRVTSYTRTASLIELVVYTDWDTSEKFSLRYPEGDDPARRFLLRGKKFEPDDWRAIESEKGRLRQGVRATVWVCEGEAHPIVDWQPPAETRR